MNLELALSSSFQESLAALASVLLGPALGPAEGPGRPLDRLTKKEVWRVLSAFEDALAARGGETSRRWPGRGRGRWRSRVERP